VHATPLILGCLAATWLIWGSTDLAIKWALISLPPFFRMRARFLVAGALLLASMRVVRKAPSPTRRQWAHAASIGLPMPGGGMSGTAYAERTVESGLVVAFIAMLLGVSLAGELVTAWEWWAAAVIVGGVLLPMARRWR